MKEDKETREPTEFDKNWREMTGNTAKNPSMGISSNTMCRDDKS